MTDPIDLKEFNGWVPFAKLPDADVPTQPGVYIVLRPSDEAPSFPGRVACGAFQGKGPDCPGH